MVWHPASFFFNLQTTTAWPRERRWVLLLEDNRLPFWGQLPLQTHSWSERQGQEALAALKSVRGNRTGLQDSESAQVLPGLHYDPHSRMDQCSQKDQTQSLPAPYVNPVYCFYWLSQKWFKDGDLLSSLYLRDATTQGSENVWFAIENQKQLRAAVKERPLMKCSGHGCSDECFGLKFWTDEMSVAESQYFPGPGQELSPLVVCKCPSGWHRYGAGCHS